MNKSVKMSLKQTMIKYHVVWCHVHDSLKRRQHNKDRVLWIFDYKMCVSKRPAGFCFTHQTLLYTSSSCSSSLLRFVPFIYERHKDGGMDSFTRRLVLI